MPPRMTCVVPTLNGAERIPTLLDALEKQSIIDELEIIIVDDGSTDATGEVAMERGFTVLRNAENLGVSGARNAGLRAAKSPVVAFLDDDCRPPAEWAQTLLAGYDDEHVLGVGGPVEAELTGKGGFLSRYVERNHRHEPLELNLQVSSAMLYRLRLYLQRQWTDPTPQGRRDVHALGGANMSFRTEPIRALGGFDERFRFGSEEEDLTRRLRADVDPDARMVFDPTAWLKHRFDPSFRDLMRRAVNYGTGNALQYRKWEGIRPTLFPWPVLVLLLLGVGPWLPAAAVAGALAPVLLYPRGLKYAVRHRRPEALADAYLKLLQEALENYGFIRAAWRYRSLTRRSATGWEAGAG